MSKMIDTLKRFEEKLDTEAERIREAIASTKDEIRESVNGYITLEEEKESYKEFFKGKLEKYNVSSPDELEDDKKKEFFDEVEKDWTGETNEDLHKQLQEEVVVPKFISDEETEGSDAAIKDKNADDVVKEVEDEADKEKTIEDPETDDEADKEKDTQAKKAKEVDQIDVTIEEKPLPEQ